MFTEEIHRPGENRDSYGHRPSAVLPERTLFSRDGTVITRYAGRMEQMYYITYRFRSDGQDYRTIGGTQLVLTARVSATAEVYAQHESTFDEIMESLAFHDTAMPYALSEAGQRAGITTSVMGLINAMVNTLFETEGHDWHYTNPARTIPAFELLIGGELDIIIVPDSSEAVLEAAREADIELELIPISIEALVFITSAANPVEGITTEQLLDIYVHNEIAAWDEISPYSPSTRLAALRRNTDSGSHTQFDNFILQGRPVHPSITEQLVGSMAGMLDWFEDDEYFHTGGGDLSNAQDVHALGYTMYAYFNQQMQYHERSIKILALDGIHPSPQTIRSGEYPLATYYYAALRKCTPHDHPARLLANWLLSPEGQETVNSAGLYALKE
jgi:phosphate transport system substrate-binding protein